MCILKRRKIRPFITAKANPFLVYINTFAGTGANGQSAYVTFSFANSTGFDAFIPVKVIMPSNASANPVISYSRSTDGGATYETALTIGAIVSNAAGTFGGATLITDLILRDPGQYLVQVLVGGGSSATWSVQFGATIQLITAYA